MIYLICHIISYTSNFHFVSCYVMSCTAYFSLLFSMFVVHAPSSSDGDTDRDRSPKSRDRGSGSDDRNRSPGGIFGTKVESISVLFYSGTYCLLFLIIFIDEPTLSHIPTPSYSPSYLLLLIFTLFCY